MKKLALKALVGVALIAQAGTAMPGDRSKHLNALLKGKYRFTLNQVCTYTLNGFKEPPPALQVVDGGFSNSGEDYITGFIEFDGDGNMSGSEKGVFQNHGGFFSDATFPSFPIATYTDQCTGTYEVNADRSFTYEVGCDTDLITGFSPGTRIRVDGIRYEGQIEAKGEAFIAAGVDAAVQTQYFTQPDGPPFTQYRVCGGHLNAVRVSR
jgi:hypothetical protein